MGQKLFGTDGIRGLANEFPMTGEVAMAVGRAVAHVLRNQSIPLVRSSVPIGLKPLESSRPVRRARIVVGKDTRLSGYMLEQAISSGLCSMGADVILIGPLSTPGVAFVTQSMRADAGIMISASHNPYYDNGIKIFSADGYKLPDEMEAEIERLVLTDEISRHRPTADLVGKAQRIDDVHGRYLVFLKNLFPKEMDLLGFRVALDCANGAAYKVAPLVFEELGAEVIKKGVSPNGLNINDKCGALHPEAIAAVTVEFRADIGISLDGDGDRCILSDENGEVVDGDQIIGLCAMQMAEEGTLRKNTIVTTPMSNLGLELSLRERGISMVRAQVGDRYVVDAMRKNGFSLGGEQSGHIIFLDQSTTGDGIVAALKVLEVMKRTGKRLSELKKCITLFPQVREDVRVSQKAPFESIPEIAHAIVQGQAQVGERGRLFVRYSGTEALARVMVEGEDLQVIQGIARSVAQQIQKYLG
ncbi:MAG TPA: phosphoglucosamine mutase [Bdellovibrionales bacterium]|nr:MAG: phosphoglucosamine mutase [Bdellovibrionales bacterium GWB1_52_6]OFZ05991.1 MAG: phosphoglucosamine mutase [Bdellovibrionales bacterium GWA1_52_35]OFZ33070.1 MAG: phosphoglucosamine mutase [Bdellovibrionales bacterium GWC1_52_8]HAR41221.1 phosphoglucosamine mutase [Bdellovibrionales bacterium]HCM39388.1 phosphoglucosamine mutase [Bdellovibrionales bacterium]